jgi:hypothetical protein
MPNIIPAKITESTGLYYKKDMSSITPTKISHHFIVLEKNICVKYHHSKDITSLCCIIKTYVKYHSCKDITSLC